MAWFPSGMADGSFPCGDDGFVGHEGIERCPFLRNINKTTSFSFYSPSFHIPAPGAKGPIFEDEPNFEMAFKLFHGKDGVVPLLRKSDDCGDEKDEPNSVSVVFNPLAAKAATISLSGFGFGPGSPFSFDFFAKKWKKQKKNIKKRDRSSQGGKNSSHESSSNEWLQTGQCPIAKSYRAVSGILPLVAKAFQPPPGVVLRCPPAVVAARAALARTAFVKNLRPQPLPAKMLAIALLGMAANVPLGIWREHTEKFSPQWFAAVHAAVPFIAMLRKSVLMPKTAMVITLAASILGQSIGARAERVRLKAAETAACSSISPEKSPLSLPGSSYDIHAGEKPWQPLPLLKSVPAPPSSSKAEACC